MEIKFANIVPCSIDCDGGVNCPSMEAQQLVVAAMRKLPEGDREQYDASWHALYGLMCIMTFLSGHSSKEGLGWALDNSIMPYVELFVAQPVNRGTPDIP